MDQDLGRAVGAAQRPGDLAVVHAEREAHDQRLAPVVGEMLEVGHHLAQLLAPLGDRLGVVLAAIGSTLSSGVCGRRERSR